MAKRFAALLNGYETTAYKRGGNWLVGGDYVQPGQKIQILSEKNGTPAWFSLNGSRMRFCDFASECEIERGLALVAQANANAAGA